MRKLNDTWLQNLGHTFEKMISLQSIGLDLSEPVMRTNDAVKFFLKSRSYPL